METITYFKRKSGNRVFRHVGFQERTEDYILASLFDDSHTFTQRKHEIEDEFIEVKDFDINAVERITCGRRMSEGNPVFKFSQPTENIDYYEIENNGDKTCSYCGSCSWELFLQIIDKIIAGEEGYSIEKASGKNYKYYVRQPNIHNASEGAIKFYTFHVPQDLFKDENKEELEKQNNRLANALRISWNNFASRTNGISND